MRYAIVHIADIHYKKEEPEGVSTVLKAFIKDLKKQKDSFSDYKFYIAITGDIVFAGLDSEAYDCLKKELNQELVGIGLTKEFRIIVPRNHDIDQSIVKNNLDDYKTAINKYSINELKFNNFICNKNIFAEKFENYELFESDFAKYGIDFSTQGRGWNIDSNLGAYCLNTALTSYGGVENIIDKKNLTICTRELIDWCNSKKTSLNILLMHHPINYLNSWGKDEIKRII